MCLCRKIYSKSDINELPLLSEVRMHFKSVAFTLRQPSLHFRSFVIRSYIIKNAAHSVLCTPPHAYVDKARQHPKHPNYISMSNVAASFWQTLSNTHISSPNISHARFCSRSEKLRYKRTNGNISVTEPLPQHASIPKQMAICIAPN